MCSFPIVPIQNTGILTVYLFLTKILRQLKFYVKSGVIFQFFHDRFISRDDSEYLVFLIISDIIWGVSITQHTNVRADNTPCLSQP